jgi:DNA-binding protein YbaB
MIQDLCAAAVNAALERAQRSVQEEFQKLQSSMVIPGAGGAEPS